MLVLVSVCGPARSAARGPSLRWKRPLLTVKSKNVLTFPFLPFLVTSASQSQILVVTHLEAA